MRRATSERVMAALAEAERRWACWAPVAQADIRACRRRVKAGVLLEPFPDVFVRPCTWEGLSVAARALWILRALSKRHPAWAFCSYSAACAYGLSVSNHLLSQVHVRSRGNRSSRYEIACHSVGVRRSTRSRRTCYAAGVRVVPFWEAVVDCLCSASFEEGLAIADSALRVKQADARVLVSQVERLGRGRHGIAGARRVASCADGRSESGGESIARAVMMQLGFQVPDLQVVLNDPVDVHRTFRVDYLWELPGGKRIAGEFDGLEKTFKSIGFSEDGGLRAIRQERQREARLTALVDGVLRLTYADVVNPGRLERILEAYGIPRVDV